MSVSEKQTVEIVKMLYRGSDILILDEPTAVLTPQETEKLFAVLRNMRADGRSIIIITHKLHEVLALSDRVSVLRKGKYIGTVNTCDATESSLTEMMVGEKVSLNIDRPEPENPREILKVSGLTCLDNEGVKSLDDVSFTAFGGEILGVAGIAGSGQKELLEAIAGLRVTQPGSHVIYHPPAPDEPIAGQHVPVDKGGEELLGKNPRQIHDIGVSMAFVPEDRLGMGLAPSLSITDNMLLKTYSDGRGIFVDRKRGREEAEPVIRELGGVTPAPETPVRRLSGGRSDHRGADPDRADRAPPAHQAGGAGAGYQPGAAGRGPLHPEDAPWRIDGRTASATAAAVIPGKTGWPWSSASAAFSRRRSSSPPRLG